MFFEMRFDLGTLDSGERSLPFGLLVFLFFFFFFFFMIDHRETICIKSYESGFFLFGFYSPSRLFHSF